MLLCLMLFRQCLQAYNILNLRSVCVVGEIPHHTHALNWETSFTTRRIDDII